VPYSYAAAGHTYAFDRFGLFSTIEEAQAFLDADIATLRAQKDGAIYDELEAVDVSDAVINLTTADAVKAVVEAAIADIVAKYPGATAEVVITNFTAPIKATVADKDGTAGSVTYKIAVTVGDNTTDTKEITATILASYFPATVLFDNEAAVNAYGVWNAGAGSGVYYNGSTAEIKMESEGLPITWVPEFWDTETFDKTQYRYFAIRSNASAVDPGINFRVYVETAETPIGNEDAGTYTQLSGTPGGWQGRIVDLTNIPSFGRGEAVKHFAFAPYHYAAAEHTYAFDRFGLFTTEAEAQAFLDADIDDLDQVLAGEAVAEITAKAATLTADVFEGITEENATEMVSAQYTDILASYPGTEVAVNVTNLGKTTVSYTITVYYNYAEAATETINSAIPGEEDESVEVGGANYVGDVQTGEAGVTTIAPETTIIPSTVVIDEVEYSVTSVAPTAFERSTSAFIKLPNTITTDVVFTGYTGVIFVQKGTDTDTATAGNANIRYKGDTTNDGDIDGFDVLDILKHISGLVLIDDEVASAASNVYDAGTDEIDGFDVLQILKSIAGYDGIVLE
ncbi:MAG: hypothetical protein IJO74_01930, partial [Clostridia bacterium]|nr:hypothetical protein [Clostridia bacterium]